VSYPKESLFKPAYFESIILNADGNNVPKLRLLTSTRIPHQNSPALNGLNSLNYDTAVLFRLAAAPQ